MRGLVAVGALVVLVATGASVRAAPACSVEVLNALHVPDVSVTDAAPVAAAGTTPAFCDVHGTVVTKGAGVADGLARFAMQLPEACKRALPILRCRRQRGQPGAVGEHHRPRAWCSGWRAGGDHPDRHRPAQWRRHHREVDAPAGRRARCGEADRFLPSRRARRHRRRPRVRRGLLFREGGARLFRWLLDRRTHGDDGGRALPSRIMKA